MLWSLAVIFFAFVLIWFTSDAVVKSITSFAERINLSAFSASFILLGILTSAPEFSIGINSIIDEIPQVFVGNLLGGIIVLFCFVSPFLAVVGNGIKLSHSVNSRTLVIILILTGIPGLIALRGFIDYIGAAIMMLLYLGMVLLMKKKKSLFQRVQDIFNPEYHPGNLYDILKISTGMIIIFFAGKLLVDHLEIVSNIFKIPPYLIALLALSIGSNLPELFIGTLSVLNKQKEVAFGHYLGSAASNGFFLGLLTVINGPVTITDPYFYIVPIYITLGLLLFYFFVRKNNDISRYEGIAMLLLYLSFVVVKILVH